MESHAGRYEDYDAWRVSHKITVTGWAIIALVNYAILLVVPTVAIAVVFGLFTIYSLHMLYAFSFDGYNRRVYEWWKWGSGTPIYKKRPTGPEHQTAADKLDYGHDKRV